MSAAEPTVTTLLLVRHAESTWSADRRFAGSSDPPLSEAGCRQAADLADVLGAEQAEDVVDLVVTSPMLRARQTAAPIAARLGAPVAVDDRLRETDFGAWEGRTFAEAADGWPAAMAAWLASTTVPPPGGESFAQTTRRVRRWRDRSLHEHAGRRLVVVSHGTPVKVLLRLALLAPPTALGRLQVDLASVSEVRWFSDGPAAVVFTNRTCGPRLR